MNLPDTEAIATIRSVVTPELTAHALAGSADEQRRIGKGRIARAIVAEADLVARARS
jgi:hypothetical protein